MRNMVVLMMSLVNFGLQKGSSSLYISFSDSFCQIYSSIFPNKSQSFLHKVELFSLFPSQLASSILFEFQMEKKQMHPYSSVNLKREDIKTILYDAIELPWGELENYTISHKVGRGKYAHVFEGRNITTKEKVVIKVLLPIKPTKIKREYHILKQLDHPNIIKVLDIVKCSHLKTASLVFEPFQHQDFRELYPRLQLNDIKIYMKKLLEGLDYIHSKGIMHRDIKPFNVLINHKTQELKIIDFGLSEYYFPSKENNTKVASLYYKAPELYFSNTQYDYRVDCWSVGMILAGMIFKKTPFLVGNDPIDQILKLTKLVGAKKIVDYIKEFKLSERRGHKKDNICFDILIAFENGDIKAESPSEFEEFITPHNEANATFQAIDLIKRLLAVDYKKRLTAKQALEHPFFDGV